jgi:hypothetical protein
MPWWDGESAEVAGDATNRAARQFAGQRDHHQSHLLHIYTTLGVRDRAAATTCQRGLLS